MKKTWLMVGVLMAVASSADAYDCNRIGKATQAAQLTYRNGVQNSTTGNDGNSIFDNPFVAEPAGMMSCASQIQGYFSSMSFGSWYNSNVTHAMYAAAVNYFANQACGEINNVAGKANGWINTQLNKVPTFTIPQPQPVIYQ